MTNFSDPLFRVNGVIPPFAFLHADSLTKLWTLKFFWKVFRKTFIALKTNDCLKMKVKFLVIKLKGQLPVVIDDSKLRHWNVTFWCTKAGH
jgi:hypothetical protein